MADARWLDDISWQAFERFVCRLLRMEGLSEVRLVGQSSDKGADVLGTRAGKRWLVQVKHWKARSGIAVIDRTVAALRVYRADVPVVVALGGFDDRARDRQRELLQEGVPLQLWSRQDVSRRLQRIAPEIPAVRDGLELRDYQANAVGAAMRQFEDKPGSAALVAMATGLGKTVVAAEVFRRINERRPTSVLILAHTNDLVYQLERSFWPFLMPSQRTSVWNGTEPFDTTDPRPGDAVFASVQTAAELAGRDQMPDFDLVVVDECHHVGSATYDRVLTELHAGTGDGPSLLGLSATPWRADDVDLSRYFGAPLFTLDLVSALRQGFLANVDYRMYTDNINWESLEVLKKRRLTPREVNKAFFVTEWDVGVAQELANTWREQEHPRAIVFCGTVAHAVAMADRINALGFCAAKALHANSGPHKMAPHDRSLVLSDFADGLVDVICTVDLFNEGLDVPDVNILVFQRVTHSRRIFIQQLGRGLRLSEGKDRAIVLDFVSDVRRFAAGLDLKDHLAAPKRGGPVQVELSSKVEFRRVGGEDTRTESFLRAWLEDVAAIEAASDDASVLRYPPPVER